MQLTESRARLRLVRDLDIAVAFVCLGTIFAKEHSSRRDSLVANAGIASPDERRVLQELRVR